MNGFTYFFSPFFFSFDFPWGSDNGFRLATILFRTWHILDIHDHQRFQCVIKIIIIICSSSIVECSRWIVVRHDALCSPLNHFEPINELRFRLNTWLSVFNTDDDGRLATSWRTKWLFHYHVTEHWYRDALSFAYVCLSLYYLQFYRLCVATVAVISPNESRMTLELWLCERTK